jgi:hypothetical protein
MVVAEHCSGKGLATSGLRFVRRQRNVAQASPAPDCDLDLRPRGCSSLFSFLEVIVRGPILQRLRAGISTLLLDTISVTIIHCSYSRSKAKHTPLMPATPRQ